LYDLQAFCFLDAPTCSSKLNLLVSELVSLPKSAKMYSPSFLITN